MNKVEFPVISELTTHPEILQSRFFIKYILNIFEVFYGNIIMKLIVKELWVLLGFIINYHHISLWCYLSLSCAHNVPTMSLLDKILWILTKICTTVVHQAGKKSGNNDKLFWQVGQHCSSSQTTLGLQEDWCWTEKILTPQE